MMQIRMGTKSDVPSILQIYNQGIEDRVATLEMAVKDDAYMNDWFDKHQGRFAVLVAEEDEEVIGWASIKNRKALRYN